MSDVSIGFYGVKKIFRCLFVPVFEGGFFWQLIKGIVEFNGVEIFCIVFEPFAFRDAIRVEAFKPMVVAPAGSAYPNVEVSFAHSRYFNALVG